MEQVLRAIEALSDDLVDATGEWDRECSDSDSEDVLKVPVTPPVAPYPPQSRWYRLKTLRERRSQSFHPIIQLPRVPVSQFERNADHGGVHFHSP